MNELMSQSREEYLKERGCAGKVSHRTKDDATIAMKKTKMQNKFLSVYRCEFCDEWHVGKNDKYRKSHKRVMRRHKSRAKK